MVQYELLVAMERTRPHTVRLGWCEARRFIRHQKRRASRSRWLAPRHARRDHPPRWRAYPAGICSTGHRPCVALPPTRPLRPNSEMMVLDGSATDGPPLSPEL